MNLKAHLKFEQDGPQFIPARNYIKITGVKLVFLETQRAETSLHRYAKFLIHSAMPSDHLWYVLSGKLGL